MGSDNDGVMDSTEGENDFDRDRIRDYIDVISEASLLPVDAGVSVLQTDVGLTLRLGEAAFATVVLFLS